MFFLLTLPPYIQFPLTLLHFEVIGCFLPLSVQDALALTVSLSSNIIISIFLCVVIPWRGQNEATGWCRVDGVAHYVSAVWSDMVINVAKRRIVLGPSCLYLAVVESVVIAEVMKHNKPISLFFHSLSSSHTLPPSVCSSLSMFLVKLMFHLSTIH
jgi:hypothetical protein